MAFLRGDIIAKSRLANRELRRRGADNSISKINEKGRGKEKDKNRKDAVGADDADRAREAT